MLSSLSIWLRYFFNSRNHVPIISLLSGFSLFPVCLGTLRLGFLSPPWLSPGQMLMLPHARLWVGRGFHVAQLLPACSAAVPLGLSPSAKDPSSQLRGLPVLWTLALLILSLFTLFLGASYKFLIHSFSWFFCQCLRGLIIFKSLLWHFMAFRTVPKLYKVSALSTMCFLNSVCTLTGNGTQGAKYMFSVSYNCVQSFLVSLWRTRGSPAFPRYNSMLIRRGFLRHAKLAASISRTIQNYGLSLILFPVLLMANLTSTWTAWPFPNIPAAAMVQTGAPSIRRELLLLSTFYFWLLLPAMIHTISAQAKKWFPR